MRFLLASVLCLAFAACGSDESDQSKAVGGQAYATPATVDAGRCGAPPEAATLFCPDVSPGYCGQCPVPAECIPACGNHGCWSCQSDDQWHNEAWDCPRCADAGP